METDDGDRTTPRSGAVRELVRRFAVDLTPFRVSRDFRLLFLGLLVSQLGYQFTLIAIFIQVRDLTGSEAAVGFTGVFGLAGLVIGSLVTGSFVDAHDRRLLLIVAQLGSMIGSAILLAGALAGEPPLWVIYGAVAFLGFLSTIDGPVRGAMTPRLVGVDLVPSALALQQVVWTATALVGPAVAGVVVARFGLSWAYGFDVVTYLAMLFAAIAIRPMAPERGGDRPSGWPAVREGFRFVRGSRLLVSTFVVDLVAMIFGLPRILFAFLAASQFDRGLEVVGLLFAAPSVGALLGAATSGWTRRVTHQGTAVVWSVVAWGAAIAAFGLVRDLWVALALLAVAGWADVISAIFRSTILQVSVPDHLRGRMQGIHILVVTGGPQLGDVEAGLVASWTSPVVSVVSGGVACIVGAGVVAWLFPELRRYRAGTVETAPPAG